MPALTVDGLYKVFGDAPSAALDRLADGASTAEVREETGCTVAVRDVSLTIRPQEVFVVMGLSGSGKSTLLRCLNRLVEPTAGTVHWGDEAITAAPPERLRTLRQSTMSMVFQGFGLFPHRSVLGNVEYGLEVSGMPKGKRRDKARRTLDRVGLGDHADSRPDALSGGMQQRVGLARALATDPEVLLMDEPFSALDPLIRADMQDELLDLQAQWEPQCTIVFITHDLDEALKLGDRIAIMKDGRVVQVGTPQHIVENPASAYVRSFVQNVDRTAVLTASSFLTETASLDRHTGGHTDAPSDAPSVAPDTPLKALLPLLLDTDGPVAVRASDGKLQGIVDRTAVRDEMHRALDASDAETPDAETSDATLPDRPAARREAEASPGTG